MHCGVSTASLYPMNTKDALIKIGENGVKHCEIFVNTISEVKAPYLKELNTIANNFKLTIDSLHPFTCAFDPFMMFTGYEQRFFDYLEYHKYYFEAMNELNAKIFVFHGDRKESTLSDKEYCYRFGKLKEIGKSFGITVAQENVGRCKSRSIDFLLGMVEYFDGDLSIVFDNKQAIRSGVDYKEFIDKLGKNIIHVHISDNDDKNDCLAIGKGTLDIADFKNRMIKKGFNGSMVVELYRDLLDSDEDVFESYRNLALR